MKVPAYFWLAATSVAGAATAAPASRVDDDKSGGPDHPLVSRYAGSPLYLHGGEDDDTVPPAPAHQPGRQVRLGRQGQIEAFGLEMGIR